VWLVSTGYHLDEVRAVLATQLELGAQLLVPDVTGRPWAASASMRLVTAPVDYLNSAVKAEQNAVKTVDTTSLNQVIKLFNVDKGRNPKDLNELVEQRFIAKIPEVPYGNKLVYDANAGKVTVVKE